MKKMIFSVVAIATLSSAAFFLTGNKLTTELTPIQLANIEALANGEAGAIGCVAYPDAICALVSKGEIIAIFNNMIPVK